MHATKTASRTGNAALQTRIPEALHFIAFVHKVKILILMLVVKEEEQDLLGQLWSIWVKWGQWLFRSG